MVLGELIYTKAPVYLDDINIHSKTFGQHLQDLREVFECIRKANLKIRLDKCQFCSQDSGTQILRTCDRKRWDKNGRR